MTLTRQSYATPWNILPNDLGVVDRVAEALYADPDMEDHPFADEFNHIGEHSIELASVWLNWAIGDRAVSVVPILCGSFGDYFDERGGRTGDSPANVEHLADAIGVLTQVARERRTVFIAAADLAHIGPAFGDPDAIAEDDRKRLEASDARLLNDIAKGDRDRFFEQVRSTGDSDRICGLAPIYMTLWATGPTDGEWMGYMQCPADAQNGSVVSIAGALLYER
jgi:hypothetical protein